MSFVNKKVRMNPAVCKKTAQMLLDELQAAGIFFTKKEPKNDK